MKLIAQKLLIYTVFSLFSLQASAAPNVVTSIAPIHSLVSMVMEGLGQPVLLIKGAQSPHTIRLKPSIYKSILAADMVVLVDSTFETSLAKPILKLPESSTVVDLLRLPNITRLKIRDHHHNTLNKNAEVARYEEDEHHDEGKANEVDPHLWLSFESALTILDAIGDELIKIDPIHKIDYQNNVNKYRDKINAYRVNYEKEMIVLSEQNYFVFHDAYQYFANEFKMKFIGALTASPDQQPGLKSILDKEERIKNNHIPCIFHEPQFESKLANQIAKQAGIQTVVLDPLGVDLKTGVNQWFELMRDIKSSINQCVGRTVN